jgi:hypothetical protein
MADNVNRFWALLGGARGKKEENCEKEEEVFHIIQKDRASEILEKIGYAR